jgi:hypothetical protein
MRCEYSFIEGFLHRWVFNDRSIAAFDDFEPVYEKIVREMSDDATLYMLVDYRPGGMPPLRMMVDRIKEIYRRVGRAPRDIRVAYVMNAHDLQMMEPLNTAMLDKLPSNASRRYFEDYNNALLWLQTSYKIRSGQQ